MRLHRRLHLGGSRHPRHGARRGRLKPARRKRLGGSGQARQAALRSGRGEGRGGRRGFSDRLAHAHPDHRGGHNRCWHGCVLFLRRGPQPDPGALFQHRHRDHRGLR
eukprot:scaffold10631_cov39-Phaeocystis_antarctica.AAC.3